MRSRQTLLVSLMLALLPTGCGEPSLEVRGTLDRVVGETVTLKLVEGKGGFSSTMELVDSQTVKYSSAALQVKKPEANELSFVVPAGIAQGKASARIDRDDSGEPYVVPLDINRLALALDDKGAIETLPLTPATLAPSAISSIDAAGGLISLSPSGGELAVLAKDQLNLLALGASSKPVGPGIAQTGGQAIAAVPDGVLVCTDSALLLVRIKQSTSQISASITGCKAVAADSTGVRAVVLSTCDSDNDTNEEDCLTEFQIGSTISQVNRFSLDMTPSATHVAMRSDGKGAVVADSSVVYGVWLDGVGFTPVSVPWDQTAAVVGIDVTDSSLGDLFAVADGTSKQVRFLGFDSNANNDLKRVFDTALPETPIALSFGPDAVLYVAAGTKLYSLNAEKPAEAPALASISSANPILFLQVQP